MAARFVRDEEAAGSNPATPTQVIGHSHSRKWPFPMPSGQRPGRSADRSGAFDEIPGVMLGTAGCYPAVIWRRLRLAPPIRPVRRVGAGTATGTERVDISVELLRRRASVGHMCTAC